MKSKLLDPSVARALKSWLWLVLMIVACGKTDNLPLNDYSKHFPPETGGQLLDAISAEPSGLITMIAGEAAASAIASNIFASLLKYDQKLELTGELAESWQISPDQKTITFHLRPNLKWADGVALTSKDALFTWQLITKDSTRSPYSADFKLVVKAEVIDDRTFQVHYSVPYAPALATWAGLHILPKHLLEHEDINTTSFARQPVGSHYYQLKRWINGQTITLIRNHKPCCGEALINERISRIIPDKAAQFLELTADHIDLMGLSPVQYARIFPSRPALDARIARYKELGNSYTYLGFNLKRAPFDDKRVRLAINYAINKQEIIDGVLLGLGEPLASPYKPGTRWSNPQLKPYPYNPQQAMTILKEAGYVDSNGDGVLDKNGKALSFEILTNQNKEREMTAVLIQRRLKEIGIDVQIRVLEWASFISRFIKPKNFDAVILGWSLSPDPDQYNIWHSSQQGDGQFNFISYSNPQVDKLLEAGRITLDANKRESIYHQFSQVLLADSPIIYLSAGYGLTAIHRRVQGVLNPSPPAGISFNHQDWYISHQYARHEMGER